MMIVSLTGDSVIRPEDARAHIQAGVKKIGYYDGPSSTWFAYQGKLDIAAGMIIEGVELLEPNLENAKYLWKLVVRVSKKLIEGGVDDSNGTVGGAIRGVVDKLAEFAAQDEKIKLWLIKNATDDTGVGFEDDLRSYLIT